LSQLCSIFLLGYSAVALIALLGAPWLVAGLFSGFDQMAQTEVSTLMRILLLQPLLLGLSSLIGVVTQLQHRFVIYALSPLVYNVGIILGATVFFQWFGLIGLAFGVVVGALGHLLIQLPLITSSALAFGLTRHINWVLMREIARVAVPRALTLSLGQLHILVLAALASSMTVGSVAVLQFSSNLQSVPLAIIGMSYSVAAFPTLAQMLAEKKHREFNTYVTTALRHIIFWSVPVIALVVVLRAQIVRVLLGSGSFDWADTRLTAAALALFVISLSAQAIMLLLVRAFYAGGLTKIPFIMTLVGAGIGTAAAVTLSIWFAASAPVATFFTSLFRLDGVAGVEVLMLPLGFTIGVTIEMLLMLIMIRKTFTLSLRSVGYHFLQSCIAAAVGGLVAYATLLFVVEGVNQERFIGILLQGACAGILGIGGIVVTYRLLRSPELHEIYLAFRSRIFKTDVVAPQTDIL
jgi:putative peptidoglycan lipid II flippase